MLTTFGGDELYHELVWALKLLPDLRLDTLTIDASYNGSRAYNTVDNFVRYGSGSKKLCYISRDSIMLSFSKATTYQDGTICLQPQPGSWKGILLSLDGIDFQADVTMSQRAEDRVTGAMFGERNGTPLIQVVPFLETLGTFGLEVDSQIMSESHKEKELLVIVRRGNATDIKDHGKAPYHRMISEI